MEKLVVGLDIGTGGARAVAVDCSGRIVSSASCSSPPPYMDETGVSEQDVDIWTTAAFAALGGCVKTLRENSLSPECIRAICVDGTSGTVVLLDREYHPVGPGLMHNDTRASVEAAFLNERFSNHCSRVGYGFGATFALSKLLWLKRIKPDLFQKGHLVAHQADYFIGRLTGEFGVSDPSNALKTGYDLVSSEWPREMEELGMMDLLPRVVPSGTSVGTLQGAAAKELGLSENTEVLTGVTDSTAAFLATGASLPGEFCVCLGTTMAFKGVSETLVHDPQGVVYCHRHPSGKWLPGGASNVGGACIKSLFPNADLEQLDREVASRPLTRNLCYPLVEVGERFPFQSSRADGFYDPVENDLERYLSLLQGVAIVEKWCFQRIEQLGVEVRPPIFTTGGGANSDVWNQIRANVLQLPLARSRSTDPAFGVAVLAGAKVFYDGNLEVASREMTGVERVFEPESKYQGYGEDMLRKVQQRCRKEGWV